MKRSFDNIRRSFSNFSQVRQHVHYDGELLHKPCGKTAQPLPSEFELLLWNIFKGGCGEAFERDICTYANSADLLCLQEVLFNNGPQLPADLSGLAYDYSPSYSRVDSAHEGVMTLSKHALNATGKRLRSVGSEPVVSTPKSAVVSSIPLANGKNLTVLNIHMLLVRSQSAARDELKAALELLENTADTRLQSPALFVGDFNTMLPRQLALVDSELQRHNFQRIIATHDPRRLQLDHVYSRGFSQADMRIDSGLHSSDHPALVCHLQL